MHLIRMYIYIYILCAKSYLLGKSRLHSLWFTVCGSVGYLFVLFVRMWKKKKTFVAGFRSNISYEQRWRFFTPDTINPVPYHARYPEVLLSLAVVLSLDINIYRYMCIYIYSKTQRLKRYTTSKYLCAH